MPGSHRIRALGRTSSHRQALIKNLVTSLIEHESITTTFAKAKETQRVVEKLITLGKRGSCLPSTKGIGYSTRIRASSMLFSSESSTNQQLVNKIFNKYSKRYINRPGGYTRLLHLENRIGDNSKQSILQLVDSEKDIKKFLTARIIARLELQNLPIDSITQKNLDKVTKYSTNQQQQQFRNLVENAKEKFYSTSKSISNLPRWATSDAKQQQKTYSSKQSFAKFQPKWKSRSKLANIFE